MRLSERWMDDMKERVYRMRVQKDTAEKDTYVEYASACTPAVQFLVIQLSNAGIPFRLLNLGAGVRKITTKDLNVCPKCKGSGKI